MAVTCALGAAEQDPEKAPFCDTLGASKLQLTPADTTILGITIGKSSFEDVEAKLGPAQTSPRNTICYISRKDGTVLTFRTGPMGGFQFVTQFGLWSREANFPNTKACTSSEQVSRSLSTESGIRLALNVQDLDRIAGTHPKINGAENSYQYLCRQKMTEIELTRAGTSATEFPYWFVTSSLDAWLAGTRVTHVEIGKFTSY